MSPVSKTVRRSVTLSEKLAAQVRTLAKIRGLSFNRMLVELIKKGMEAEQRNHHNDFFELVQGYRNAEDPEEARRLGDKLGHLVFVD